MSKNEVAISGVVKWEPKLFPPREDGQKPIMVFALEYAGKNNRTSVFHFKAYGELAETLDTERLAQGDTVLVSGMLNEAKWKDKRTDEWVNRIEVWANKVEFMERVGGEPAAHGGFSDMEMDDIPF